MFQLEHCPQPSLMPVPQLAQKQVGIVARIVDVVKDGCAADFAGVIHYDIAKAEDTLGNRR